MGAESEEDGQGVPFARLVLFWNDLGGKGNRGEHAVNRRKYGGARRNRTADNGFADHCLTTWRPRHRGSCKGRAKARPYTLVLRSGRVKPGESEAPPVQFSALHCKFGIQTACPQSASLKITGLKTRHYNAYLAGGGSGSGLGGAGFVDDGSADEVPPFGPRAVVVADLVEAEQILEYKPGV
jgi:hypothetical protein